MNDLYPSYTLIFLVFNLLGWWFNGKPFISWWWFILIVCSEIIIASLLYAWTKKMLELKR
jgi:hypothetical protein